MSSSSEIWKDVVGYEGIYKVSSFGKVKRIKASQGTSEGKILKPIRNVQTKYLCVGLCSHGIKQKNKTIHRLVLEAFIGPGIGLETRHLDGNVNNNKLSNLSYGTHGENMKDRTLHGRHFQSVVDNRGTKHGLSKLTDDDVIKIKTLLNNGRISQKEIAALFDIHQVTISKIKLGKLWKHLG